MVFCHWDFVTIHICQESDIFICSSSYAKNDTKVAKQVWSSFFRIEKFYNLSKYNIIISFASFADCSTKKPSWLIMIIASNSHQHTTTNVENVKVWIVVESLLTCLFPLAAWCPTGLDRVHLSWKVRRAHVSGWCAIHCPHPTWLCRWYQGWVVCLFVPKVGYRSLLRCSRPVSWLDVQ